MNDLYDIPFLLTTVLTVCVLVFCYRYFSGNNIKIGKLQWFIIIIISFFIMINNLREDVFLKSIMMFLLNFLLYYAIFRDSLFKLIHLGLYICVLTLFTDFLFSILIIGTFSDINYYNHQMPLEKIFYSIIVCYAFYFIYKIPFFKKIYIIIMSFIENKKNNLIILYLIFGIIATLYILYILSTIKKDVYILIILIIIFIYLISSLYFKENYKNNILKIKNTKLIENQILFKRYMEDYRVLRHNLLNDLLFIKTLCSKETQAIINEKISRYKMSPDMLYNVVTLPEGLQGIIYLKSSVARNYNINFYVDNMSKFNKKSISNKVYIDLCEIISILLDNAIEASSDTNDKVIYLNIIEEIHDIYIEIINTFLNDINIDEIGNLNYSTKKRNSGLGLNYINNLNKKIKIKKEIINNLFKISIIIKK